MKLPLLVSVPHAGTIIPSEVRDICLLTRDDIIEDGDKGAGVIYGPLENEAAKFMTANVARAIVDLNRPENYMGPDGVVKTHTIRMKRVYDRRLSEETVKLLIDSYWRPYHEALTSLAKRNGIVLGVDCHTMLETAPPIGPDPGSLRPAICIANADGTCPDEWIEGLARSFESAFNTGVGINKPFKGGHIIRFHSQEMPWVQIEVSRGDFMSEEDKARCMHKALSRWCQKAL